MNILKPHVSLNVSNIDASVAFYEKALGVSATSVMEKQTTKTGCCVPKVSGDASGCSG
jgi:catechol 2,3-dioxygenase-like lactoylglutathione lyase family enzyme